MSMVRLTESGPRQNGGARLIASYVADPTDKKQQPPSDGSRVDSSVIRLFIISQKRGPDCISYIFMGGLLSGPPPDAAAVDDDSLWRYCCMRLSSADAIAALISVFWREARKKNRPRHSSLLAATKKQKKKLGAKQPPDATARDGRQIMHFV